MKGGKCLFLKKMSFKWIGRHYLFYGAFPGCSIRDSAYLHSALASFIILADQ
jgi:hypothetical protein